MKATTVILWMLFGASVTCAAAQVQDTQVQLKGDHGKFPIVRRDDLMVRIAIQIDLAGASATGRCTIQNLGNRPQQVKLRGGLFGKKSEVVEIASKASHIFEISTPVMVSSLGPETKVATLRPYLILETGDGNAQLLFADHNINIEVRLPAGARMVKASQPLTEAGKGLFSWTAERVKTLPPLRIWYTTAAKNIEIRKTVNWTNAEASVRIQISNLSREPLTSLHLRTQLPATLYAPVPEKTEGEFIKQSHDMLMWDLMIHELAPGETRAVVYTVIRIGAGPSILDSEILIYNKAGDLIATQ